MFCPLYRELGCPLLGGSKCIRTTGKPIIWDFEKRPLLRGLLYCVPIYLGGSTIGGFTVYAHVHVHVGDDNVLSLYCCCFL